MNVRKRIAIAVSAALLVVVVAVSASFASRGGTHKRVSLGLHPVSLRKSKEMGWNWQ